MIKFRINYQGTFYLVLACMIWVQLCGLMEDLIQKFIVNIYLGYLIIFKNISTMGLSFSFTTTIFAIHQMK